MALLENSHWHWLWTSEIIRSLAWKPPVLNWLFLKFPAHQEWKKKASSFSCTSVPPIFLSVSLGVCCLCLVQGQRHPNKTNVSEVEKNIRLLVQVEHLFFFTTPNRYECYIRPWIPVLALHFWTNIFFLLWLMSAEGKFQVKRPLQCYFRAEAILSLFSSSFHFPDAILSLALGSPHRH